MPTYPQARRLEAQAQWLHRLAAVQEERGDRDAALRLYGQAAQLLSAPPAAAAASAAAAAAAAAATGAAAPAALLTLTAPLRTRHDNHSGTTTMPLNNSDNDDGGGGGGSGSGGGGGGLFPYAPRAHFAAAQLQRACRRRLQRKAAAATAVAAGLRGHLVRRKRRRARAVREAGATRIQKLWASLDPPLTPLCVRHRRRRRRRCRRRRNNRYQRKRHVAATAIQSLARGARDRARVRWLRAAIAAAARVQRTWRGCLGRARARRRRLRAAAAAALQALARGYGTRRARAAAAAAAQSQLWRAAARVAVAWRGRLCRRYAALLRRQEHLRMKAPRLPTPMLTLKLATRASSSRATQLAAEARRARDEAQHVRGAIAAALAKQRLRFDTPEGRQELTTELERQTVRETLLKGAWEKLDGAAVAAARARFRARAVFDALDLSGGGRVGARELRELLRGGALLQGYVGIDAQLRAALAEPNADGHAAALDFEEFYALLSGDEGCISAQQWDSICAAPGGSSSGGGRSPCAPRTASAAAPDSGHCDHLHGSSSGGTKLDLAQRVLSARHALAEATGIATRERTRAAVVCRATRTAADAARAGFRAARPPRFACLACGAPFALYGDFLTHMAAPAQHAAAAAATGVVCQHEGVKGGLRCRETGGRGCIAAPHALAARSLRLLSAAREAAAQWRRAAVERAAAAAAADAAEAGVHAQLREREASAVAGEVRSAAARRAAALRVELLSALESGGRTAALRHLAAAAFAAFDRDSTGLVPMERVPPLLRALHADLAQQDVDDALVGMAETCSDAIDLHELMDWFNDWNGLAPQALELRPALLPRIGSPDSAAAAAADAAAAAAGDSDAVSAAALSADIAVTSPQQQCSGWQRRCCRGLRGAAAALAQSLRECAASCSCCSARAAQSAAVCHSPLSPAASPLKHRAVTQPASPLIAAPAVAAAAPAWQPWGSGRQRRGADPLRGCRRAIAAVAAAHATALVVRRARLQAEAAAISQCRETAPRIWHFASAQLMREWGVEALGEGAERAAVCARAAALARIAQELGSGTAVTNGLTAAGVTNGPTAEVVVSGGSVVSAAQQLEVPSSSAPQEPLSLLQKAEEEAARSAEQYLRTALGRADWSARVLQARALLLLQPTDTMARQRLRAGIAFDAFDADGHGLVDGEDLEALLSCMRYRWSWQPQWLPPPMRAARVQRLQKLRSQLQDAHGDVPRDAFVEWCAGSTAASGASAERCHTSASPRWLRRCVRGGMIAQARAAARAAHCLRQQRAAAAAAAALANLHHVPTAMQEGSDETAAAAAALQRGRRLELALAACSGSGATAEEVATELAIRAAFDEFDGGDVAGGMLDARDLPRVLRHLCIPTSPVRTRALRAQLISSAAGGIAIDDMVAWRRRYRGERRGAAEHCRAAVMAAAAAVAAAAAGGALRRDAVAALQSLARAQARRAVLLAADVPAVEPQVKVSALALRCRAARAEATGAAHVQEFLGTAVGRTERARRAREARSELMELQQLARQQVAAGKNRQQRSRCVACEAAMLFVWDQHSRWHYTNCHAGCQESVLERAVDVSEVKYLLPAARAWLGRDAAIALFEQLAPAVAGAAAADGGSAAPASERCVSAEAFEAALSTAMTSAAAQEQSGSSFAALLSVLAHAAAPPPRHTRTALEGMLAQARGLERALLRKDAAALLLPARGSGGACVDALRACGAGAAKLQRTLAIAAHDAERDVLRELSADHMLAVEVAATLPKATGAGADQPDPLLAAFAAYSHVSAGGAATGVPRLEVAHLLRSLRLGAAAAAAAAAAAGGALQPVAEPCAQPRSASSRNASIYPSVDEQPEVTAEGSSVAASEACQGVYLDVLEDVTWPGKFLAGEQGLSLEELRAVHAALIGRLGRVRRWLYRFTSTAELKLLPEAYLRRRAARQAVLSRARVAARVEAARHLEAELAGAQAEADGPAEVLNLPLV
ncbi:hypothetical protein JKP88DRAFT_294395 [Tribonema minus]|uniref:EF-hand domain-containing protein n=1 Tax=Tribonema minus TaxID=303371 RepID=A0A835ZFC5_9STRA|nr:hypothetical protein JKP88DRAFT_294395 [Tribonema minus]